MKLFTKYNRINLLSTVCIFVLAGIAFFFLLRYVVIGQVDDDLRIEQHEIETYVTKYQRLPEIIAVRDQNISYAPVATGGKKIVHTIRPADKVDAEKEPFRELVFYVQLAGGWQEVKVSKSLEGTDNMIQSIASITFITILLIMIASLVINRFVLKRLWQPFYESLAAMRHFELGKNKQPDFPDTKIEEFTTMNETLRLATGKAAADYQHLKEFTENASHELQTPLAIITSKMDVLIQDDQLSEQQSKAVQDAYSAIQRMARLNHALLLLTKIDNGQFAETTGIDMRQKVKDKIAQFEEMIAAKQLVLTSSLDETADIEMNPVLADILLNNLFSNAIKYNKPGGQVDIIVEPGTLEISNTSNSPELDKDRLFRRFTSAGKVKDGVGLGLAIVRQVAEVSGLKADYTYEHGRHHFIITSS